MLFSTTNNTNKYFIDIQNLIGNLGTFISKLMSENKRPFKKIDLQKKLYEFNFQNSKEENQLTTENQDMRVKFVNDHKQDLKDYNGYYTGKMILKDNKWIKDGFGRVTYDGKFDGDEYIGFYRKNKRNGEGTYFYKNKDQYDGQWKDSKKEGKGTFYFNNGDMFDGFFKNNKMNGIGFYNYSGKFEGDCFIGNWKESVKHGFGLYLYNNGNKYIGLYDNGKDVMGFLLQGYEMKRERYNFLQGDEMTCERYNSNGELISETIAKDSDFKEFINRLSELNTEEELIVVKNSEIEKSKNLAKELYKKKAELLELLVLKEQASRLKNATMKQSEKKTNNNNSVVSVSDVKYKP